MIPISLVNYNFVVYIFVWNDKNRLKSKRDQSWKRREKNQNIKCSNVVHPDVHPDDVHFSNTHWLRVNFEIILKH